MVGIKWICIGMNDFLWIGFFFYESQLVSWTISRSFWGELEYILHPLNSSVVTLMLFFLSRTTRRLLLQLLLLLLVLIYYYQLHFILEARLSNTYSLFFYHLVFILFSFFLPLLTCCFWNKHKIFCDMLCASVC